MRSSSDPMKARSGLPPYSGSSLSRKERIMDSLSDVTLTRNSRCSHPSMRRVRRDGQFGSGMTARSSANSCGNCRPDRRWRWKPASVTNRGSTSHTDSADSTLAKVPIRSKVKLSSRLTRKAQNHSKKGLTHRVLSYMVQTGSLRRVVNPPRSGSLRWL
jgi:hypothetical protein